jgi:hypothetical protein
MLDLTRKMRTGLVGSIRPNSRVGRGATEHHSPCCNSLSRPAAAAIHYETGPAARNFISIIILPADGHLRCQMSGTETSSPIYRQLSDKPLSALINLHGVPNTNHNGGSRI